MHYSSVGPEASISISAGALGGGILHHFLLWGGGPGNIRLPDAVSANR